MFPIKFKEQIFYFKFSYIIKINNILWFYINYEVHCTVVGVIARRAGTELCRSRPGKTVSAPAIGPPQSSICRLNMSVVKQKLSWDSVCAARVSTIYMWQICDCGCTTAENFIILTIVRRNKSNPTSRPYCDTPLWHQGISEWTISVIIVKNPVCWHFC